jgi:hypothetical protein
MMSLYPPISHLLSTCSQVLSGGGGKLNKAELSGF